MPDREKVIRELKAARLFFEMGSNRADGVVGNLGCKSGMKYIEDALELLKEQEDLGTELTNAMELIHKKNERIKKLEEQIEALTKWRMNAGAFD